MIYVLYFLEVVVCLFLILVVLLQQGSGADLSVFGGGATQTAFGARGTTQFIHKLTVWAFVAFILLTLAISIYKGGAAGSSVITGADPKALQAPKKPTPVPAQPAAPGAATQQVPVQTAPAPASSAPAPAAPAAPAQQAPAPAPSASAPAPQTP